MDISVLCPQGPFHVIKSLVIKIFTPLPLLAPFLFPCLLTLGAACQVLKLPKTTPASVSLSCSFSARLPDSLWLPRLLSCPSVLTWSLQELPLVKSFFETFPLLFQTQILLKPHSVTTSSFASIQFNGQSWQALFSMAAISTTAEINNLKSFISKHALASSISSYLYLSKVSNTYGFLMSKRPLTHLSAYPNRVRKLFCIRLSETDSLLYNIFIHFFTTGYDLCIPSL